MLYFSDVDNAGHTHGPDAAEVDEAIRAVDRALGRLLDGIESLPIRDRVHLILVSDHGMAALDTTRAERLDAFVDLEGVQIYGNGPYATLWVGDSARVETIRSALAAGLKHARVYRRDEIPERFRYKENRRVGDLLVLAEPGWQVVARNGRAWSGGTHGYDPVSSPMHGIFFAMGPSIRAGTRIPAFENIHVYPLIAHILGLRPNPAADGRLDVLRPILR
jgi:predicted AlkP superfamily pyrophosphatase or phosphodiesterase